MEEIFGAVLSLVMFGLLLTAYLLQRRDRREARRRGPVRGRVVSVEREEYRTRSTRWRVVTVYELPDREHNVMHTRFFGEEGPALLWARLHREGSEHDVYPNVHAPGEAFVTEDLRKLDPLLLVTLAAGGGLLAYGLWQMASEFLGE